MHIIHSSSSSAQQLTTPRPKTNNNVGKLESGVAFADIISSATCNACQHTSFRPLRVRPALATQLRAAGRVDLICVKFNSCLGSIASPIPPPLPSSCFYFLPLFPFLHSSYEMTRMNAVNGDKLVPRRAEPPPPPLPARPRDPDPLFRTIPLEAGDSDLPPTYEASTL